MEKSIKTKVSFNQWGFTLLEVLVVIAILGIIAAIALVSVGKFSNSGKEESYKTELKNINTAITLMFSESKTQRLVQVTGKTHFVEVMTTDDPPLILSDYLLRLKADTSSKTGCWYDFYPDGTVIQHTPTP